MDVMPDFSRRWEYENGFYLTCDSTRLAKLFAQYELFRQTLELPGAIVECGVFKGASLLRFAMMRDLFGNAFMKKIIGFDIFGRFPDTDYEPDIAYREKFVNDAGEDSISTENLTAILSAKGCNANVELVAGDICETVPAYLEANPHLKISLLNLDTDIYEPAAVILEHLYPRIVPGGILILDDYGTFPGETKAVDDYFRGQGMTIKKFTFCMTPCYLVKS